MSLNEDIRAVVTPIVKVCDPDYYGGEDETYCVFGYTEIPDNFGNNVPQAYRRLVDLHLYVPLMQDSRALRRKLRRAIIAVDTWTAPTINNASDETGQHYVFEFEAMGDIDDGDD